MERVSLKKPDFSGSQQPTPKLPEPAKQAVFNLEDFHGKNGNGFTFFDAKKPVLQLEPTIPEGKNPHDTPINILFRLTAILKAINQMRLRTFYRPLKYAKEEQIGLINDISYEKNHIKDRERSFKQYTEKNVILWSKNIINLSFSIDFEETILCIPELPDIFIYISEFHRFFNKMAIFLNYSYKFISKI